MDKYETLWNYFQADLALSQYEAELDSTETRRTLKKIQKYIQDGQSKLKNMERDSLVRVNELSEISTQHQLMQKQLSDGEEELASMLEDDLSELDVTYVRELIKNYESLNDSINRYKKQIANTKAYIEKSNAEIKKIVQNMQRAKKQFDALKEQYDTETKANAPEITKRKGEVVALAKQVDADLLARYNRIKRNRRDPVAQVIDGKCSGCNMALPSGAVPVAGKVLECENCGRLLVFRTNV